jgi:hypothetical protein
MNLKRSKSLILPKRKNYIDQEQSSSFYNQKLNEIREEYFKIVYPENYYDDILYIVNCYTKSWTVKEKIVRFLN